MFFSSNSLQLKRFISQPVGIGGGPLPPSGVSGVGVTGSPVALGGYVADASISEGFVVAEFNATVDSMSTIVVRVNGVIVHAALDIIGSVTQTIDFTIFTGDEIVFWLESGAPSSLTAQINEAT